jgi:hypothetical protein
VRDHRGEGDQWPGGVVVGQAPGHRGDYEGENVRDHRAGAVAQEDTALEDLTDVFFESLGTYATPAVAPEAAVARMAAPAAADDDTLGIGAYEAATVDVAAVIAPPAPAPADAGALVAAEAPIVPVDVPVPVAPAPAPEAPAPVVTLDLDEPADFAADDSDFAPTELEPIPDTPSPIDDDPNT